MLSDLTATYYDLQDYAMPYYEHYSTSLSPYRAGFVSGYERCCAFVTDDNFRKDLNKALLTVALSTFLGAHLLTPLIIPTIALSLSKIYLLSNGLDYLSVYLAQQALGIKESDPERAESYNLYSGFIKSVSDTILITGMATTLAAPLVGLLSHVQFHLAYNIIVPTTNAIIRTIGFELTKGKDVAFDREVKGVETSEYLLKAVLIGASYKAMSSMLGISLVADLLSFVTARSLADAVIEAKKEVAEEPKHILEEVPKHMWKGLNSSVGFCAQYFLLGFSEKLIGAFCESSTALSAIIMRSTSMKLAEEPVKNVKAYYEGLHERVEAYCKDMGPKAVEIIAEVYGHANRATERLMERIESSISRQPG